MFFLLFIFLSVSRCRQLWKQLFLKHFSQNMVCDKELEYLGTVKQGLPLILLENR